MADAFEQEVRHCFKQSAHMAHNWPHSVEGRFWCQGQGVDPTSQKVNDLEKSMPPTSSMHDPDKVNDETQRLLNGRVSVYGDRVQNMERVAQIWSGVIGHEVSAEQVCLMFMAYKIYRASITPDYSDNYDDILGYGRMFEEVVEANGGMIKAVTVDEYLKKKFKRDAPALDQKEGQDMDKFLEAQQQQFQRHEPDLKAFGNPYRNVERDTIRIQDAQDFLDERTPDEHSVD